MVVPVISPIYTHSSVEKKKPINRKAARGGLTEASRCCAERMSWANTGEDKTKKERASRSIACLETKSPTKKAEIHSLFLHSIYFHFQEGISRVFRFENPYLYYNCLLLLH